jgi:hypothetical protein
VGHVRIAFVLQTGQANFDSPRLQSGKSIPAKSQKSGEKPRQNLPESSRSKYNLLTFKDILYLAYRLQ